MAIIYLSLEQAIEILVMTIDSFNKRSNTIFKKTDKLMGERYPFQYVQETCPILILDESQNYTTEKSKAALRTFKPSDVREGYFAKKRGTKKEPERFIDTAFENDSKTVADKEAEKAAYELIMKKKEQLLSFEEPVCFIFAHSALREGWDNPNVFQICTLREISSEKQRRQTVGRGLRLPVTQSGYRMMDRRLNTLTVIANESYNNYVDHLQKEYAETGDLLPARPANASEKETVKRNESIYNSRDFKNFWNKLIQKTEYKINIETEEFIKLVASKLNTTAFPEPHIVITKGNLDLAMLQHSNEGRKIRCAGKHFASLGVSYRHVTNETTDWWKEEERKTEVLIK